MSIFFGIKSLSNNKIQEGLIQSSLALQNELSPNFSTHSTLDFFVLWKDLKIWGENAAMLSDASVSLLAGNPIHYQNNFLSNQPKSLYALNTTNELSNFLRDCYGSFCGFKFQSNSGILHVFSDKLGVRPIYWGVQDGVFFFSSALWILEKLNFIKKTPDPISISEIAAFGAPLSTRTPYKEIKAIGDGELLSIINGGVSIEKYWDWGQENSPPPLSPDTLESLKAIFKIAVRDRLGDDKLETAFLSGGMDSRLIAANLVELDADVSTLNFAPNGTQDLTFGALAAEALGTRHFELPLGPDDFGNKQVLAINGWRDKFPEISFNRQIWSGDGGSVGLGHVYLNKEIIDLLVQNKFTEASNLIAKSNKWGIPKRLFRKRFQYLSDNIPDSILLELGRWKENAPERAAYLFLMTNDQRRHLADHYEKIHLKGFDFKLPFFDARLIQCIISIPIYEFIDHKIYNEWLLNLSGKISSIPWQSYPGHHPCPLPIPDGLRYQWRDCYDENDTTILISNNGRMCLNFGLKNLFLKSPLSSFTILLAGILTKLKIRDQEFFATYAKPFIKYFTNDKKFTH